MSRQVVLVFGFLLAGGLCPAQSWELGAVGGFARDFGVKVERNTLSANAGFKPGVVLGVRAGETGDRLGGEVTYLFRGGAARLEGGGKKAGFFADQHVITADFLWHFSPRQASVRPFFVAGAGARTIRGIGVERAFQEHSQLAVLTRAREVDPIADVGFGIKARLGKTFLLRVEFRDYIGPGSSEVIAVAPGARRTGLLHDLMGLVGISFVF